jgi:hypothetical protein
MMLSVRWGKRLIVLLGALLLAANAEANVVIKALVVNPSETQTRRVPFKSYLPKEVKPENIINLEDLELVFDPAEGAYYVTKEIELGPKETVQIEIEMEDVWKVEQKEIDFYRNEAVNIAKVLAVTDYAERASYVKNSIIGKLDQIEYRQKITNPSPSGYISDYRENVKLMETVKVDLASLKALLIEVRGIAPMLTWKLILAVVLFLGIIGIIFFVIWQRQIRAVAQLAEEAAGTQEAAGVVNRPESGEQREGYEEKRADLKDIEERLRRKPEEP